MGQENPGETPLLRNLGGSRRGAGKALDQKDDLHAGRTPRVQAEGFAVRDLLNHFRTSKTHLLDARKITDRTFQDYHSTCERLAVRFGRTRLVDDLTADDFARLRAQLVKTRGPGPARPDVPPRRASPPRPQRSPGGRGA